MYRQAAARDATGRTEALYDFSGAEPVGRAKRAGGTATQTQGYLRGSATVNIE